MICRNILHSFAFLPHYFVSMFHVPQNLVAKKGRASYLGERAIGHIDPGSASSAILFQTLLDVIHG